MDCPNCGGPMILTDHVYRCSPCRGKYLEKLKSPHRLIIETANEIAIELAMAKGDIDNGEYSKNGNCFVDARKRINVAMELVANIKDISRSQQGVEPIIVVAEPYSPCPAEKPSHTGSKRLTWSGEHTSG